MSVSLRALSSAAALVGALGGGLAAYAWWESTQAKLVRHDVAVPGLPAGLDGLRILHVSDTHFPANGASLERFAELIAEVEYDIVFASGDYVETAAGWDSAVEAFSLLHAPFGVYASLGAHDYLSPISTMAEWRDAMRRRAFGGRRRLVDPAPFVERLERLGVRVLRNEWTQTEISGEILRIAGAGDDSVGMAQLDRALPPKDGAGSANGPDGADGASSADGPDGANGADGPDGADGADGPDGADGADGPDGASGADGSDGADGADGLTVLLTHSPDALLRLQHPPPLSFCGHTHGGQIRIPGYGAPVRHSQLVDRRQTAGVFQRNGAQVVVSQGFGTAIVPLRFLCPPEIGLIHLTTHR